MSLCLNIGCGSDYREGYINIDACPSFFKVDMVIDLNNESIRSYFDSDSVDIILANDIVEHFYHWEAVALLKDFHHLLKPQGKVEIKVPDAEYIIKSWRIPFERKMTLLFGGQDINQGVNAKMEEARKANPQYFCHKYGWTQKLMKNELVDIGFCNIETRRNGTNFIACAKKANNVNCLINDSK